MNYVSVRNCGWGSNPYEQHVALIQDLPIDRPQYFLGEGEPPPFIVKPPQTVTFSYPWFLPLFQRQRASTAEQRLSDW